MEYAVPTTKADEAVHVIVKIHYAEKITTGKILIGVGVFIGTLLVLCSPCIIVSWSSLFNAYLYIHDIFTIDLHFFLLQG